MDIIEKSIKSLVEAEYNPRRIAKDDFEQLKRSLQNFTCVEPAVINSNKERKNVIIGGHQRIKAAIALKWKTFPCVLVDLPLEKEKELNVRLNKNTGSFDFDALANFFDMDELQDWGFDEAEFGVGDIDPIEEQPEDVSVEDKGILKLEFVSKDYVEVIKRLQQVRENNETNEALFCKMLLCYEKNR